MTPTRIVPGWSTEPAGRPVRPAGFAMLAAGALLAAASPLQAATASSAAAVAAPAQIGARPQWIADGNDRAALRLISLLQSAELDGLDPNQFKVKVLKKAIRCASGGNPAAVDRANDMLDRALVSYVTALRQSPSPEWAIVDRAAVPSAPAAAALLGQAAAAPSLEAWVDAMPFMHHSYAELRRALAYAEDRGDDRSDALLRINLARTRFLPASGRYVLVNTAAQRLYMYENGQVADWMRVVVGKPGQQTPMMAAMIRFTAVNPYWNVPPDLAAERIAPNVVKEGIGYLKEKGYVVLTDWSDKAMAADPANVDWDAVAAGRIQIRIRQNPGPANAMGRMKFMFPNPQGVYLHDTPDKQLLNEAARLFSGGCVRLEDAPRLAKWLYGKPLVIKSKQPELPIDLDRPVPVYLAYLTAVPSGSQVVFYEDIYGKDRSQLAAASRDRLARR
jgi:murein L,D-transpeptidase YcbB/YkuD